MKIKYTSEEVRLSGIGYKESDPVLYNMLFWELDSIRKMSWEQFKLYFEEELSKSDKSKRIKQIGDDLYEFRLPPRRAHGVLRAIFTLDGDYYTLRISEVYIKNHEPKGETRKGKSDDGYRNNKPCKPKKKKQ